MTDAPSRSKRRRAANLWCLFLILAAMALLIGLRMKNLAADFHPVYEPLEIGAHQIRTVEFSCRQTDDYEIGFEFIMDLDVPDFERLVFEHSSPLPIEWTVIGSDKSKIAQGSFKEFSYREVSRKKNRILQQLLGLRRVADLKRRIVRGVGKFQANSDEAYQLEVRTGEIPASLAKTDPRMMVHRNRRLMQRELSKGSGLVVLAVFLMVTAVSIWIFPRFQA